MTGSLIWCIRHYSPCKHYSTLPPDSSSFQHLSSSVATNVEKPCYSKGVKSSLFVEMSHQAGCQLVEVNHLPPPLPPLGDNQPVTQTGGRAERPHCGHTQKPLLRVTLFFFKDCHLNNCWCKRVRFKEKLHFAFKCTHNVLILCSPSLLPRVFSLRHIQS